MAVPVAGDFHARQIGVFTGTIINLTVAALFVRWIQPTRVADALAVGVAWLMLTLAFEVAFGRVVMHASWERILSDYNLVHGGLLAIGLIECDISGRGDGDVTSFGNIVDGHEAVE